MPSPRMIAVASALLSSACADRVLPITGAIHHDDFAYSVGRTETIRQIGDLQPVGVFRLVQFRVDNQAKRVAHVWTNDTAYLVDDRGRLYETDQAAQQALDRLQPFGYHAQYTTPAGATDRTMLVFDLPAAVQAAYLKVRGAFLMGDLFDGHQFSRARIQLC